MMMEGGLERRMGNEGSQGWALPLTQPGWRRGRHDMGKDGEKRLTLWGNRAVTTEYPAPGWALRGGE